VTLEELVELEASWQNKVSPIPGCFGWEPYSLESFSELLAIAASRNFLASFLDAGAGIGTKVIRATHYGLIASGIDLVPEFLAEAARIGADVQYGDVREWDYSLYGIVYVNHPLIDQDEEAQLEFAIHDGMASGSVLVAVNYGIAPDWPEIGRIGEWNAVWVKP
jgi:SAM-dependent methyltransferase